MKIAVDTQTLLRNAARRMVFGGAELAGVDIVMPETAAHFAKSHYHKVSRHYIEDSVEWEDAQRDTPWSSERIGREIAERLEQASAGFGRWIDEEARRNDGVFTIAQRSPSAAATAMEIARAGAVKDPKDQRWEIGEDPFVLGEALEAGAHWIASDNLETLDCRAMEDWLDEAQHEGRFHHVPRPFILSAEETVDTMIDRARSSIGGGLLARREERRMLANAVSRPTEPGSTARRIQILSKMGRDIRNAGLRRTGREIHQWQVRKMAQLNADKETLVATELARMDTTIRPERVARTRAAETRRIALERGLGGQTRQRPHGGIER